jgi:hypothetical protein
MEVKPIDCSKCNALCCKVMGKILPEYDRGDCVCKYLTDDNKCSIYEDRPFICNTVRIYNKYYKDKYTIEQWNELNNKACEALNGNSEEEQSESKEQIQK